MAQGMWLLDLELWLLAEDGSRLRWKELLRRITSR